jgi:uncharacterized protein YdeI (YjbR/CyaY-like superfamily)
VKQFKTVDDSIASSEQWKSELTRLRRTLLATKLEETVKWGAPAYTYQGKNVVGIGGFRSCVNVREAIELVEQGAEIRPQRAKSVTVPPELKTALGKRRKAAACDVPTGTFRPGRG